MITPEALAERFIPFAGLKYSTEAFIDYCNGFYGPEGLYAAFFALAPLTRADFEQGVRLLLDLRYKQRIPFEGDSMDRESLRDILLVAKGLVPEGQTEFQTTYA